MTGQRSSVVRRAGEQYGRTFCSFGNENDGMQFDTVAHGNHDIASDMIKAIVRRLGLGWSFIGQGGLLAHSQPCA